MDVDKLCIFCGSKPEVKNNEHVIPRWLIELTGNPKRNAHFGYKRDQESKLQLRTFSFNAFKFPFCKSCNQKYSKLETDTKIIIEKILTYDSLSAGDFNILLDWFDKLRIGLWLALRYLDKNPAGITPKFYIEQRVGINDRMLAIFKTDADIKGINYFGCEYPSFTYTPSCFSVRINNIFFLNMSYNDLFSRRIGFPYPIESFVISGQKQLGHYTQGRNRIMIPLLKKRLTISGTEIYQPMFRFRNSEPQEKQLYDTKYVHENSRDWERGIGKVFIQDKDKLKEYPSSNSREYVPSTFYESNELLFKIRIQTLEWQCYIDNLAPSLKNLQSQEKRNLLNQRMFLEKANRKLLNTLRDLEKTY
jgi:hypothetical protein